MDFEGWKLKIMTLKLDFWKAVPPIDIDEGNKEKPRLKMKEFKHKWKENNKLGSTVHYWLLK